ncbi:hypothetical protein OROMI_014941 [Orobanche minor]
MGKQGRIDIFFSKKRTSELDPMSSSVPLQITNNASVIPDDSEGTILDNSSNKYRRIETEGVNLNSIERDPGLRQQICEYPPNQHDDIRRAYLSLKRYELRLEQYPISSKYKQTRRFQSSWYDQFQWLEYSPIKEDYRVNLFSASINSQLQEINGRFSDSATELLILSATLNPQNPSSSFDAKDICQLVDKFYSQDFRSDERLQLDKQLEHYEYNAVKDSAYNTLSSVSELCQWLVSTGKSILYNLVFRVIELVLTLPVSTATSERSFSAMKIVKTSLRNKMADDFLSDALMIYIEREIAQSVGDDDIIKECEDVKKRRVLFH